MIKEQLAALHYAYPISIRGFKRILQHVDTLDDLLILTSSTVASLLNVSVKKAQSIQQIYERMRAADLLAYYDERHIQLVLYTDETYPLLLRPLFDAPAVLYARGDVTLLNQPRMIACIGARKATAYSIDVIKYLLPPLLQAHYVIVSGLAQGADTLAHRAAIHYGGKTIAVLGHGFDTIYPSSNKSLAKFMMEKHLVITEYAPPVQPRKMHFPQRNRLISGLAQGVIVTEAAERSGTMITAELALELGREVFVAPGPITSALSAGTNKLLKEGAIPVWNGYQIIEELQMFQMKN